MWQLVNRHSLNVVYLTFSDLALFKKLIVSGWQQSSGKTIVALTFWVSGVGIMGVWQLVDLPSFDVALSKQLLVAEWQLLS